MRFGLDIGGTKTEFCILDSNGKIQFRDRVLNKQNFDDNFNNIIELIKKSEIKMINKIGFSLKALVDPVHNKIIKSSLIWLNNDFIEKIKDKYKCEISLQNDAKCFALAESTLGAGKNYKSGFYLILGTGVGGATIIDNKIVTGLNNFAGEVGNIIYKNTNYEDILSGPAFLKNYNKMYKDNLLSASDILEKYRQNDKSASEYFDFYMKNLSRMLNIVINIIAPEVIVIGGGLSNIKEITNELPKYLSKLNIQKPAVRSNKFGDSAGVIGACYL